MRRKLQNGMLKRVLMNMASMASMALVVAAIGQNSACFFIAHQDEVPETAKKLRRF